MANPALGVIKTSHNGIKFKPQMNMEFTPFALKLHPKPPQAVIIYTSYNAFPRYEQTEGIAGPRKCIQSYRHCVVIHRSPAGVGEASYIAITKAKRPATTALNTLPSIKSLAILTSLPEPFEEEPEVFPLL